MSCPKTKNTCGALQYATCVVYEGYIPTLSALDSGDVNTIEEVATEQYELIETLYTKVDLTNLVGNGITYPLDVNNKIQIPAALEKHAVEILSNTQAISNLLTGFDGDMNISGWGLDFKCLVDACGDPIITLKQLIQIIIDDACPV